MIPWKRTLAWVLCALVGSVAAAAEEPADLSAAGAVTSAESEVEPGAAPESIAEIPEATVSDEVPAEPALAPMAEAAPAELVPEPDEASPGLPDAGSELAETTPEVADALLLEDTEPVAPAADDLASFEGAAVDPQPSLGPVGFDSQGREGRIHIVASGDTLWDISDLYLGTPWVWPSIWRDNGEIKNPHLIHPGDRIWITPSEMRRISAEEAEVLLSNRPESEAMPSDSEPAAFEEPVTVAAEESAEEIGPFQAGLAAPAESQTYRVSAREVAGLITPEQMKSSASIVAKVPERVFLSQEDGLYIGLGESEVERGDEFTLFRTNDKVFDPDTGELLGYHVDFLGWVRVEETFPETSLASIRMSTGEIEQGDRVMPREPLPPQIEIQSAPTGVEGKISFFPQRRVLMGFQDFVYLNRGSLDGLEIGSPLEVFRPGYRALERARQEAVEVPDRVVAKLLVVRAETDSAVALVTATDEELELGDRFRGATR